MKRIILLTIFFACCLISSFSQPGQPDPTFGNNGIVKADVGSPYEDGVTGRQVLIGPDKSIYFLLGSSLVTKRFPDGSIDAGYGITGFSKSIRLGDPRAALQPDGKIVIIGGNNLNSSVVIRIDANGVQDSTFGNNGVQAISFSASGLAIQKDGKIIVVGGYNSGFAITRLHSNGETDSTLNGNGLVKTYFTFKIPPDCKECYDSVEVHTGVAYSVAIQPDGRFVVSGSADNDEYDRFALARYKINGILDSTFGNNGKQLTVFFDPNSSSAAYSTAIQKDGKILLTGVANYHFIMARYSINGTLDSSFNGSGIQTPDLVYDFSRNGNSVAEQSDGKIVVAGYTLNGANNDFALVRFNNDGSLDATFDKNGIVTTDFNSSDDQAYSAVIQPDGKIIVAGFEHNLTEPAFLRLAASRYNTDGSPDISFDNDGKLVGASGQGNTMFTDGKIQNDGKILVAGVTWNGVNDDFVITRFNVDGSLDNTFNNNGIKLTDIGAEESGPHIAIQKDAKIILAGSTTDKDPRVVLIRYTMDGKVDSTFDGDGKLITRLGYLYAEADMAATQKDGKIVIGGMARDTTNNYVFLMARFNANGGLDKTFDGDGIKQISSQQLVFFGGSFAIGNDGKIVVAGYNYDDAVVIRINPDGSFDNTFDNDGIQITDFGLSSELATSVALQADGKIITGGGSRSISETRFLLARYNTDGSPDTTFNGNGRQLGEPGYINSIAIQNNGKILAASGSQFQLSRYNANGSIDSTFGNNGIQVTNIGGIGSSSIGKIAISDNKLHAVGYGEFPGNFGVVARYQLDDTSKSHPLVTLVSPANNTTYTTPAKIKLTATAISTDGTITKVAFYKGDILLHTAYKIPYDYLWADVPVGNYALTAKATDNNGNVTTSAIVNISVVPDKAPTVNITSPANGARYTAPATIILSADANDPDGAIRSVRFYAGNTLIGIEEKAPFYRAWPNVPAGNYIITAKATDNSGKSAISAPIQISVLPANFLTVNITRPGNNANYVAPANITLTADAKGPNRIVKTDFYNGSALIFTEYVYPYSNRWKNVPAGNYFITAKTTDSKGNVATSQPIQIAVAQAPCSFANQPTFGFNFNGTTVANINNDLPDPGESASLTLSNGGQYTTSAHFNSSPANLYDITYVSGGSTLLFNGYTVSNVVLTAAQLTATAGTYTINLANPGIEGTLKQTITPFTDLNNNGTLDANDCAGDPIVFTYTVSAKPTFGFTFAGTNLPGSINLANINNGIPDPGEAAGVNICESGHYITSAYFHSSPSNLYKITVKVKGAGLLVDNIKQAGDHIVTAAQLSATEGFHSIALANNNITTTVTETITPFNDLDNNGAFNAGDAAGDPIVITYTLTPKIFWYRDEDGDQHASEVIITCGTDPDPGYTLTHLPVDDCNDKDPTPCPDNGITVNIINPVDGANYADGATVFLSAEASAKNGSISRVDYYERGRLFFSTSAAPFQKKMYNMPAGEYFINATATDNNGKSTFSPTVHINVLLSDSLAVNLGDPVNGATFTAPATIKLTANVKGPTGILKTDFYNGNTLIFTENVFPYSNKWRNVPAGNYSVTAKATDSSGNVATSAPIAVIVNPPASSARNRRSSSNIKTAITGTESLQVAPNPVNNILKIRTSGLALSKQLIVSVISASGVIMQTKQFSSLTQPIQLNVSFLVSGVYVIKLISGDKIMYKRFVKL